ncbi:ABC transporter permease [Pedobacter sp. GR22-6]|uniref:ABC transporter permease n=1 Tax=Pedobacter sp. GR22-6 TaxID=3127957 RepID=UPI00307DE521
MFKHLIKLIWNKRKQNFLFLSEILISFLVIFALCSMFVYYFLNYSKHNGLQYKQVWSVAYSTPFKSENKDSLSQFYEQIRQQLKALPQIEELSFSSSNYPYSESYSSTGLTFNGKVNSMINFYSVENDYAKVFSMELLEGRWFDKSDVSDAKQKMVINATLSKMMFGDSKAVGKHAGDYDNKEQFKIIGVVADTKADGDYKPVAPAFYKLMDTLAFNWTGHLLLKVGPDADAAFESKLSKTLASLMKNSDLEIKHLEDMRESKNSETLIPMMICLTIAGFLIINVALGLFGVLWYNISQRRSEIGLRMAIGASKSAIADQLVTETVVMTTLALLVGVFFAIQFPMLNVFNIPALVYLIALFIAVIFIYALVFICALYPGKQAAAIQPAIALHEE